VSGKPCKEFLLTRRSVRKFKKDDVPTELLLEAIDIARFAPSARNGQPWEFVIVKDKETREKLAQFTGGPDAPPKLRPRSSCSPTRSWPPTPT